MADSDNDEELRRAALAAAHVDRADAGFEEGDSFEEASEKFVSDMEDIHKDAEGREHRQEYDFSGTPRPGGAGRFGGAEDADFEDMLPGGGLEEGLGAWQPDSEHAPDDVDLYLEQIKKWESGPDFVNDADRVDRVKKERLRLASRIAEEPHLIADRRLSGKSDYLDADLRYNDNLDPASVEYGRFVRERAALRDELFEGKSFVSAKDYTDFALRKQESILAKENIHLQYELIDLRREAALEHFDDPRFVAEVSRHPAGLFDELLVDFDRRDLLLGKMDPATEARSAAMSDLFSESVQKSIKLGQTKAENVMNFQNMREVGRNIRHNQRAISNFAAAFDKGTPQYEIGMSALDDDAFSDGLYNSWIKGLSRADKNLINEKKSAAAAFVVAHRRFQKELDAGDPSAGKSFAVLEHAAEKILNQNGLQRKLAEIGDKDDVAANLAALHVFGERYKQRHLDKLGENLEEQVIARMGDAVHSEGQHQGRSEGPSAEGETYALNLDPDRPALKGRISAEIVDLVSATRDALGEPSVRSAAVIGLARMEAAAAGNEGLSSILARASQAVASKDRDEAIGFAESVLKALPESDLAGKGVSDGRGFSKHISAFKDGKISSDQLVVSAAGLAAHAGMSSDQGIAKLLTADIAAMSQGSFNDLVAGSVDRAARHAGSRDLGRLARNLRERGASDADGMKREFDVALSPHEPSFEVVDGAHLRVANCREDLENGKGIILRLSGIVTPPEGVETRLGNLDAGMESRSHLEEVIQRHGIKSLGLEIHRLDTGEDVIKAKLSSGEDLSQRMLRDGYAIPTKEGPENIRREYLTKQAEAGRRGLWRDGFPEMDQSWRREKGAPEMTWRDKRLRLTETVASAMAGSENGVRRMFSSSVTSDDTYRRLSRSETKLFALPINAWSNSSRIDEEIKKIARRNPSRIIDIYSNNMEILKDLRKRKDKLTQAEKVAHDRLTLGTRAIGSALVSTKNLDPRQLRKDDAELISRSGIELSARGVRAVADVTVHMAEGAAHVVKETAKRGARGARWMLNEAMDEK